MKCSRTMHRTIVGRVYGTGWKFPIINPNVNTIDVSKSSIWQNCALDPKLNFQILTLQWLLQKLCFPSISVEQLGAFSTVAKQMLEDVQERLMYRTHIYIQTDILGYKPAAGDLAYPDKLEMMEVGKSCYWELNGLHLILLFLILLYAIFIGSWSK